MKTPDEQQVSEFFKSLTKNDELLRPIYNPEAFVLRTKARGAAERGEIKKTDCKHPFALLRQYEDDDPSVKRNGKPINLFECGICSMLLWLVDPWGDDKVDV